jgi:hypothetical protein
LDSSENEATFLEELQNTFTVLDDLVCNENLSEDELQTLIDLFRTGVKEKLKKYE